MQVKINTRDDSNSNMNMIFLWRHSDNFQMELLEGIGVSVTTNTTRLGTLLVQSASTLDGVSIHPVTTGILPNSDAGEEGNCTGISPFFFFCIFISSISTLELLTKKTVNVPECPSYSFDLNLLENQWQDLKMVV